MSVKSAWRLKAPQGFERNEYTVNGIKTVVYSAGEGPPLVFWHGAGTFHGIDFAKDWSGRFRVILPHHPGFGESGPAPQYHSMGDFLEHYLLLFEILDLDRFNLVGLSLGGWMAAEFAAAHCDRLDRLVLVAPVGLPDPQNPTAKVAAIPREELLSWLAYDVNIFTPHMPRNETEAAALERLQAHEGNTLSRLAPDGPENPQLEHELPRITVPTLLIWGRDDRLTPPGKMDKWLQLLPDARPALFGHAGHMVLDESAAARRAVADFLAEEGGGRTQEAG